MFQNAPIELQLKKYICKKSTKMPFLFDIFKKNTEI